MEESMYGFQNLDHRSPNINLIGPQVCVGLPNSTPAYMKPYYYENSPNGPLPSFASTGKSQLRASQPVDTGNWFYFLPRFRQGSGPILSSVPEEEKLPTRTIVKNEGHENLTLGTGQKQFLVFDQSGDRTTLLYSSGIGAPIQPLNSCNHEVPGNGDWLKDRPLAKGDTVSPLENLFAEGLVDHQNDAESDMHEDTEELNALLYSDNDYSEDDEETSTGHSPCTMTVDRVQSLSVAEGEDVSSCAATTKRKKLLHGGYSTPSAIMVADELVDTASSPKYASRPDSEDDAESSCGNSSDQFSKGFDSFSGKKRSREENIRNTIRILQKVIPVGQGKDNTMDIIDEAINYLKSLKAKAKDLGLATL